MKEESVDQANEAYDQAEQAYLAALASGVDEAELQSLAQLTARAAKAWESVDGSVPSRDDVARYYDVPEVLATLWADLADAYDHRLQ